MPDSIDSGGSPRVALSSGSGNALFSDEPPSTSDAETADVAPAARREPSAFYIPSKDAALIDYGDERLDKASKKQPRLAAVSCFRHAALPRGAADSRDCGSGGYVTPSFRQSVTSSAPSRAAFLLAQREALRRLEEHLEHLESGIQESFEDLEGRLARLRDVRPRPARAGRAPFTSPVGVRAPCTQPVQPARRTGAPECFPKCGTSGPGSTGQ